MNVYSFVLMSVICAGSLQALSGDLNCDGQVGFPDFFIFSDNFGNKGEIGSECEVLSGDLDCDGQVGFSDFFIFSDNFGSEGEVGPECSETVDDVEVDVEIADFYTSRTFADLLASSRMVSWTPHPQSLNNLARISLGIEGTQHLLVVDDDDGDYAAILTVESGLTASVTLTYDTLLKSMFKLIEMSTNNYMIVSPKHSNYALDFDTIGGVPTLIMRDTRSFFLNTATAAYLTLSFTTSGGSTQITATGRHAYSASEGGFVEDNLWTAMNVAIDGSSAILTEQTGTAFTLYQAPLDQDMPFDFNPAQIERVSNDEFLATFDGSDRLTMSINDVVDAYREQVATPGLDSATAAAADSMLSTIESTLAAEGAELRYPAVFYKTVRENMLSRILHVSDTYDAIIGRNTVPYVYFTNETDADGIHHPFLVIASYGVPEGMTHLWDVPRPPGDGTPGTQYGEQKVTRNALSMGYMVKIAMKDYGEVETLTENIMMDDLASDAGNSDFTHFNYASVSATGIAIDGVVVYPSFNNTLSFAQEVGEIASAGLHSGRGLGAHYHADGHSATGSGLNLYNAEDYEGHTHPPLISLGFDGVAGYGKYMAGDTTSDGVEEGLDDWGGHRHGIYSYHYHSETAAQVVSVPGSDNVFYTAHMLPPRGAWRGRINEIPEFWDGRAPVYGGPPNQYHGIEKR